MGKPSNNNLSKKNLLNNERMFNTLISNLPGMVYRCKIDKHWTMEFVSQGVKELTGYKPDDLIKNKKISYNQIIHKDDRKKSNHEISKAIAKNAQFTIRYRIVDAKGKIKWVWERGQGVYDHENKEEFLEGFITDISDQVEREETLKLKNTKINTILKTIPDLFFVNDLDGNFIDVFAEDYSKLALPKDEIIGSNIKDIFPEKQAKEFLKLYRSCIKTKKLKRVEYSLTVNNKLCFFEARMSPLDDNNLIAIIRDVTEQKEYEKALIEAEENYRNTLEESPLGMRIVDKNYKTIYANKAILDIYGYNSIDELINTPIRKRYTSESYKDFLKRKKIRESERTGPKEYEISIIRKDGEIRHLIVYRKEIIWSRKKQYLSIYRDITKQKNAEKALIESEERFRSLYQNSSLGLYRTTPDGQILLANPSLVKMLGYKSFNELKSRNLENTKFFSNDLSRSFFKKKLEKNKELTGYESEGIRKDGSVVHVRESAKAITDKNGKIIYYDGTVEDITQRKIAEKALKESEEKFRNLVENAFDGIYLMVEKKFVYINDRFCEITEYTRDELLSKDFDFSCMLTKKGQEIAENRYIKRKRNEILPSSYEIEIITKTGELKDIEISTTQIGDSKNINILGITRDITERKRTEKLQQEVLIAKEALKFKQNFLANMSHEIRTPLTGIAGMTDILTKTNLTADQKEYLSTIKFSTENLKAVINQILDYSKIEAGKADIKTNPFPLKSLIKDAFKLFKSICNKNIKLTTHLDPDLPEYIEADEQKIFQVIQNLMSNAVKFTKEGHIFLRIEYDGSLGNSDNFMLKLEVEDTGIGIKPNVQNNLFKPFSQIEQYDIRNFEGTGLGLSICKELCEMMGGTIGVNSKYGEGSRFWCTFKVKIASKPKTLKTDKKTKNIEKKNLKILHVEDKVVNQKVVSLLLQSMGHKVYTAKNGKEAIDMVEENDFDFILMDIQMPVMDGVTATKILRKKYKKSPPIIGLSANAFEGDREKYLKYGMDDYIIKPINEEDFKNIIKKHVNNIK